MKLSITDKTHHTTHCAGSTALFAEHAVTQVCPVYSQDQWQHVVIMGKYNTHCPPDYNTPTANLLAYWILQFNIQCYWILQAFTNRSKNAGFCNTELDDFACTKADIDLFTKVLNSPDHVLHPLLPPPVQQNYNLRNRPHNRQLPERSSRLVDCNLIIRMLYHNMYWLLHHFISFLFCLVTCLEMRSVIS